MGTNFYWKQDDEELQYSDEINIHIGKRSAAGPYCWDCGTTLQRMGTVEVHSGRYRQSWLDYCPSCGNEFNPQTEGNYNATAIELGFAKSDGNRAGIGFASSFTWTLLKHKKDISGPAFCVDTSRCVVDEYGREYTADEFMRMLEGCPIQFQMPCEFS